MHIAARIVNSGLSCNSYVNDLAINFSNPKTQIMIGIMELHDHLMFFILMIFVLKIVFFSKSLLTAASFTHLSKDPLNPRVTNLRDLRHYQAFYVEDNAGNNFKSATLLEFIWTILPAIVLVLMAIPSFILLYAMEEGEWPMFNICAIGNQWYWTYEYMDFDIIKYYKILVQELLNITVKKVGDFINNSIDLRVNIEPLNHIYWAEDKCFELASSSDELNVGQFLDQFAFKKMPLFQDIYAKGWNVNFLPGWERPFDTVAWSLIKETASKYYFSSFNFKFFYTFSSVLQFYNYMAFTDNTFKNIEDGLEDTITIDCQILPESDLPKGYPRLLCTDQVLVLPTETYIRILVTSNDVIHSWSLPSFGIKMDGIPGRINQILLITPFFGTVWGQCSELCGINHGFMPIELRMVGLIEFKEYINLMLLSYIEEMNKTFLKTHSYSGFVLSLDLANLVTYWDRYLSKRPRADIEREKQEFLSKRHLLTPEQKEERMRLLSDDLPKSNLQSKSLAVEEKIEIKKIQPKIDKTCFPHISMTATSEDLAEHFSKCFNNEDFLSYSAELSTNKNLGGTEIEPDIISSEEDGLQKW